MRWTRVGIVEMLMCIIVAALERKSDGARKHDYCVAGAGGLSAVNVANSCVRFVFGVTAASRNTRFQAACYGLTWAGLRTS